ncbi:MAG: cbb3-type cytochrome c oxidase subunit 3 [Betaproteobacteria bacterium]|nr:cbb3-type cytochrome c oxidase subunit 3 [Betaproteobacteria bacterium]
MDINAVRAGITVAALITFLCIVAWAWSSRRRADFEAASRLPLEEDDAASPRGEDGK